MLRRKMTDALVRWKNGPDKRSLLVRGARQTGKTYTIDDFGKKNYGTYIRINFEEDPQLARIFEGSRSVKNIMMNLSYEFPDADPVPGDTLIFLDEIQNCPDARVAFKFFTIDGRYDVIGTGSLLGVRYREVSSYPVGYEDIMDMRSLDFEEFLWAMGMKEDAIGHVKECLSGKEPIDRFILDKFNEYLRQYMVVGGMPKAVDTFRETNHFGKVREIQKGITDGNLDDISKYAEGLDKNRVKASFRSVPEQLSKRNKKFMYTDIEGRANSRYETYGSSLSWLHDAGVIGFCHNLTGPALPLLANRKENAFKIYLNDTGLMVSMLGGDLHKALLNKDINVNEGGITENLVAEMLTKSGYELTYFDNNSIEVDFILNLNGVVSAIEVKSGRKKQSRSLGIVMSEKYGVKRGIKLENSNVYVDDRGVEHYPIFATAFIGSLNGPPDDVL